MKSAIDCNKNLTKLHHHKHIQKETFVWNGVAPMKRLAYNENIIARWRHRMETFSSLPTLCEGKPLLTGEILSQRPVTRSFDVFFDQRLKNQLSKQSRRRWFATPSRSLWRRCNGSVNLSIKLLYEISFVLRGAGSSGPLTNIFGRDWKSPVISHVMSWSI